MRLPLAATAIAAALALGAPATAAPTPQITDATADQKPVAGAGYDVVSALFGTSGTTTRIKRKTVYTPNKLVVTVTYAGPVAADDYTTQVVEFDAPACENVYLQLYSAGTTTFGSSDCTGEESFDFTTKVAGNTIQFILPFNLLGSGKLAKGTTLTDLRTYTAYGDPVFGLEAGLVHAALTIDDATTSAVYKVA